jgi:hypothetical protein
VGGLECNNISPKVNRMGGTSRKKYPLFPGLDLQYTNMSNKTETSGETVPLKIALFAVTAYWGSDSKEKYIQREPTPGPTGQHIITFLASGENVKGHKGGNVSDWSADQEILFLIGQLIYATSLTF